MAKDTLQKVKNENKALKEQLLELQLELEQLKHNLLPPTTNTSPFTNMAPSEANTSSPLSPNKNLSVEFVSAQYDDLSSFKNKATKEISTLTGKMDTLFEKFERLDKCLEDLEAYSYRFNVKIVGLPSNSYKDNETSVQTANLCVKLFQALGADVTISDIDTAHRVPPRNKMATYPAPVTCKFVRRLAKDEVMYKWKNRKTLTADDLDLEHDNVVKNSGK